LPRVELMEKSRSVLDSPRAAIERGRSNPRLAIAAITGALLLIAWIAWAIYVTNDHGANAGLGVVLSWPILLAALVVVASPLYLLVRVLRPSDEADQSPSILGGSADADAETEEKPAGESEDETADDEESDEEAEDEDGPEETDPDEEPPSGEKETSVSG
jgi:hypothetical protein